ncbi:lipoyl synthase [Sporomusa acidovorans]|uniref:Lipoyl synthase n=1 Tax=Sporomusa acidovorans (strain ATCC 49682 / DSM 3132 / Mol) TaxID=1123286 RepID=A0ABZ3J614_SPOA4|nr:lipoyl synthase [Sporomusa acidovorans]OZC15649.1 lipoyl synthase [Sporomusa acidovorans DSM 3132]SDE88179.1 lipoic acid synthetase [Sporomusa acidovorans]
MRTDRPAWLTLPVPEAAALDRMKALLDQGRLHTVCESADCPNIGECFSKQTCTFMILGNSCTRNCHFCAVPHGIPAAVDNSEPAMLAATAKHLGLRHVVITSVTRDDLADGGAGQFAAVVKAVRKNLPEAGIEVLIPDFQGSLAALQTVLQAGPDILNHNMETVPRLYSSVRPQASYVRSLEVISRARQASREIVTKSGLMLGLGERIGEVVAVMSDLYQAGCQMLTLGQYLRPSPDHLPVAEYIRPAVFDRLRQKALSMGFLHVSAGPMVRSSYHADFSFSEMSKENGML